MILDFHLYISWLEPTVEKEYIEFNFFRLFDPCDVEFTLPVESTY